MASIPMDSTYQGQGFETICEEFGFKNLTIFYKIFPQTDFLENVRTDRFFSFQMVVCLYEQIHTSSSKMTGEAGLFASLTKITKLATLDYQINIGFVIFSAIV